MELDIDAKSGDPPTGEHWYWMPLSFPADEAGEEAVAEEDELEPGIFFAMDVQPPVLSAVSPDEPGLVGSIAPYLGEVSWRDGGWQVKLTERDSGRFVFLPGIDPHDSRLVPVPTAYPFYPDSLGHRLDPIFGSSSPASPSGSPGR